MTTVQYKPLGLAQVCEIRDQIEAADNLLFAVPFIMTQYEERGFDPADVCQAAEEALTNLRQK